MILKIGLKNLGEICISNDYTQMGENLKRECCNDDYVDANFAALIRITDVRKDKILSRKVYR